MNQFQKTNQILSSILNSKKLAGIELENIANEINFLSESIKKTEKLIDATFMENSIEFAGYIKDYNEYIKIFKISEEYLRSFSSSFCEISSHFSNISKDNEFSNDFSFTITKNINQKQKIFDLFSLPKIMKKCITEQLYNEVYLIIKFCIEISKNIDKLSPFNDVILNVMQIKNFFVRDLIIKLSEDISLTTMIKIFSALKSVIALSNSDEKYLYLLCRSVSANISFKRLENIDLNIEDIKIFYKKHIEYTITHYLALFNSGNSIVFLSCSQDHNVFISWLDIHTKKFIKIVQIFFTEKVSSLKYCDIVDIFSQLCLCVSSTSSMDFSILENLQSIFKNCMKIFFDQTIETFLNSFEKELNYPLNLQNDIASENLTIQNISILKKIPALKTICNFFIHINNCCLEYQEFGLFKWLATQLQTVLETSSQLIKGIKSISLVKDKNSCNLYSNIFTKVALPFIFQMMWNSLHSFLILNFTINMKQINYINYIERVRENYKNTIFPQKIEYIVEYSHFQSRPILIILKDYVDAESLKSQEYFLMFKYQFIYNS